MSKTNEQFFKNENSEISERERELKELSEKALEIFKENLASIEELKEPIKIGGGKITKEAYAVVYQFKKQKDGDLKSFDLQQWEKPFEIGIEDLKNRKLSTFKIEQGIKQEIKRKIKESITIRMRGLLWLDENKKLNILLEEKEYEKNIDRFDENVLKYFQEMLGRYQIKRWGDKEEKEKKEEKEAFERIEKIWGKIVWDTQTSVYAKKQGMTNAEFLRWRIIEAKLGETGEKG